MYKSDSTRVSSVAQDDDSTRSTTASSAAATSPASVRPWTSIFRESWLHSTMRALLLVMSGIMVFHNVVLRSWGIGTFPSITRDMINMSKDGSLKNTPLMDENGMSRFLDYARTPAGRFFHILPAGLWSIVAPIQLSPTLRSKYRKAHRRLGRVFIGMSVSMAIGLVPIVLSGATVNKNASGDIFVLGCGMYFLASAVLAIHHARKKRFRKHRVWILRHVAMGYAVHLQRLLGYLTWGAFPYLIPRYTDLTVEAAKLRGQVFGAYFTIAVFISVTSMEVWLRYGSPASPHKITMTKTA